MGNSDYERVVKIDRWKVVLLIISSIITVALTINEKYKFSFKATALQDYIDLLIGLNSILILSYILADLRANYVYSKAEKYRRLQYIDDSFGTNFAGNQVSGYFSQTQISPGFYKLSVNCFEKTFKSFNVIRRMQLRMYTKAAIVALIFIFSALVGDKGIIRALIEAILPLAIIQDAIKVSIFITRLESLLDGYKSFFTSIQKTNFVDREAEAMKNVVDYEATLAWASIPLDNYIYNKLKDQLNAEWEDLKLKYNLL